MTWPVADTVLDTTLQIKVPMSSVPLVVSVEPAVRKAISAVRFTVWPAEMVIWSPSAGTPLFQVAGALQAPEATLTVTFAETCMTNRMDNNMAVRRKRILRSDWTSGRDK